MSMIYKQNYFIFTHFFTQKISQGDQIACERESPKWAKIIKKWVFSMFIWLCLWIAERKTLTFRLIFGLENFLDL